MFAVGVVGPRRGGADDDFIESEPADELGDPAVENRRRVETAGEDRDPAFPFSMILMGVLGHGGLALATGSDSGSILTSAVGTLPPDTLVSPILSDHPENHAANRTDRRAPPASARRRSGAGCQADRVLREQDPSGSGRALLQVPLGRARENGEKKLRGRAPPRQPKDGLLKGGDTGAAIVPGKPTDGTLLKALKYERPSTAMPPKGKLPDAVIKDFEKWIADGAADPRDASTIEGGIEHRHREGKAVLVVRSRRRNRPSRQSESSTVRTSKCDRRLHCREVGEKAA